jgi:hypothetical protein
MKKYIIAVSLLILAACTKPSSSSNNNGNNGNTGTPPTTNVVIITDNGTAYSINPGCKITKDTFTNTAILSISVMVSHTNTFEMTLGVWQASAAGTGTYNIKPSLTLANDFSQFTNDGYGNTSKVYDYSISGAIVNVTTATLGTTFNSSQIAGTFQLTLQPSGGLATSDKTITGTFNTTTGNIIYQ